MTDMAKYELEVVVAKKVVLVRKAGAAVETSSEKARRTTTTPRLPATGRRSTHIYSVSLVCLEHDLIYGAL